MPEPDRAALEAGVAADVRAVSAVSEEIGRVFAARHDVAPNDFRALLHVMVAETAGAPLTAGELRARMGLSGAAITYLVERLIGSGHVRRESDPADRRKVILRVDDHGMATARGFFTPLSDHLHRALTDLTDTDLTATHRTITAVVAAMQAFRRDLDG
jgi:DNA-binding MarR family transcriptional regulator